MWIFLLPGLSDTIQSVFEKVTECLLAILLVSALGWWLETGLKVKWHWQKFIPFLPLAIIPFLTVIFQINKFHAIGWAQLLIFALLALMVGFGEETIYRGIAVQALLPKGIMPAALFSALIFGLLHFANLLAGADPLATAVQVVFAILYAIVLTGPFVYTGFLWPLILLHGAQDFIAFWSTGSIVNTSTPSISETLTTLILILPFAGYGIWLLVRRARMILEKSR